LNSAIIPPASPSDILRDDCSRCLFRYTRCARSAFLTIFFEVLRDRFASQVPFDAFAAACAAYVCDDSAELCTNFREARSACETIFRDGCLLGHGIVMYGGGGEDFAADHGTFADRRKSAATDGRSRRSSDRFAEDARSGRLGGRGVSRGR